MHNGRSCKVWESEREREQNLAAEFEPGRIQKQLNLGLVLNLCLLLLLHCFADDYP